MQYLPREIAVLSAIGLILTACAVPPRVASEAPITPTMIATSTPTVASATPATPVAPVAANTALAAGLLPTYSNPVIDDDFPDPFVLRVGADYYAFATNVRANNVPVFKSADLAAWERVGDALPILPKWAAPGQGLTWAPAVLPRGERYVMYYTTRYRATGLQSISLAVSDRPEGKYVDTSAAPFVFQRTLGGSIDPSPFVDDDGTPYLLWKNDGNCCGLPTGLWIQRLSDDGLSLIGEPTELLRRDQAWEAPLIEAPAMLKRDGRYYLFYSANWYEGADYAVGYAVCETVLGPCRKPQGGPIFAKQGKVAGPGGQEFFTDVDGTLWMAYHAWDSNFVGYRYAGQRSLRIERVTFEDGAPVIAGPTLGPQLLVAPALTP